MDKKHIYIFGHKNPDTDSICSAISYAYLKNQIASRMKENDPGLNAFAYAQESQPDVVYSPRRAGQLNPETEYLLKRFNTPSPVYINDVRVQVGDINVRKVDGVTENISLKQAWTIMRTVNIATLPVLNKDRTLKGLITIGDIARSYMAVYDNTILGKSHTPYANILDALDGELITGDPKGIVQRGRVTIGTATTELIREHIEPGDVIILGNRYETQLCAIEEHASLLIVCEGSPISRTIRKIAEQNGSAIISTHFDTYTVARLINQSVPISYFMKKDDLVTFKTTDFIAEIKGTMLQKRHRDFPVLTPKKKFAGMISRRSLINMPAKQIILVDHNEIDQAVDGIHDAEVIEIVDHHKLGTVETMKPISVRNQPVGCTATIIYEMFTENNIEIPENIAGLLCGAIISDTLLYRSPTCTQEDKDAAEALAQIAQVQTHELAQAMFAAGSNLHSKSEEEIFYQDFKRFTAGTVTFGVGQITSMAQEELDEIKARMIPYMHKAKKNHDVDMVFFMLTNIINESTQLLYSDETAREVAEASFMVSAKDDQLFLSGVVSRKKQLIPRLMATLQQ
ncbi:MAG TPA: putative manganese-dependent inorganic diphosphatase [Candidatus Scybalocola faecavium]|nr:putative manganese-dependent inorganic diphosphatase [Candidatus Scybalocola faecavium]